MKKLYFLIFILTSTFSFAQNAAVNGGFESWTGGVLDSWTSESGTTLTEENTIVSEGTSAINFLVTTQTQGNTDFRQTVAVTPGLVYDVSVDVYQLDNAAEARLFADGYQGYSDSSIIGAWQTLTYEFTATAATADFGLRFYDVAGWTAAGSNIIVDNFQIVPQSTPSISVISPSEGDLLYTPNVTVDVSVQNFNVANGTGDGHIHYTVDGGSIVMKYDTNPINLTSLSAGSHSVYLELVDNSHNPIVPAVNTTVNFTIAEVQALPFTESFDYTAGETIAQQPAWTNYFSGDDALVETGSLTYPGITASGNSMSFDGSGADPVVDYTPTAAGKIYASFILQVTALDAGATDGYFATLRTDSGSYESRLWITPTGATTYRIGISNGGTLTQIAPTDLNVGDTAFIVFNYDIDNDTVSTWVNPALGGVEPTADATEASGSTGNTFSQILIRQDSATETPFIVMDELRIATTWSEASLTTQEFNTTANFNIYPNPTNSGFVNITTKANAAVNVTVFDVLGKQVLSKTLNNNTLDVTSLTTGVYILKLNQNGTSTTKRLIVE
ncbi:T9SS type A sorting domain-containing protein [Olleya marilimosa]|uniref:T9SS type A sorting domain-containing protein n=1 Tax=Olleya marilimosa TaxID=272164 RepID=A0ABR8LYG6_9FLAO|nr:T9SS type A sorting domain-containing protein [Olleya marilimosa]MBD3864159.1 T9SS type A sorting domain-containing protein [Olleya marilimosa]